MLQISWQPFCDPHVAPEEALSAVEAKLDTKHYFVNQAILEVPALSRSHLLITYSSNTGKLKSSSSLVWMREDTIERTVAVIPSQE